jgi:hypothetical protein
MGRNKPRRLPAALSIYLADPWKSDLIRAQKSFSVDLRNGQMPVKILGHGFNPKTALACRCVHSKKPRQIDCLPISDIYICPDFSATHGHMAMLDRSKKPVTI